MTRVKISVSILLFMIGMSIFSGIWVSRKCSDISSTAMAICSAYEDGDMKKSAELAKKLGNDWENFASKASVLLKYDKLFEIDRIASHAEIMVKENEDELLPQMTELIHMLDILRKNEIPYLNSVF